MINQVWCYDMYIHLFGDVWATDSKIEISDRIRFGDLALFNLETPICDGKFMRKAIKAGMSIRGNSDALFHMRKMFKNKLYASLSNNHISDYGTSGMENTIAMCKKADIFYSGLGYNNIASPIRLHIHNNNICVFSVSEPQFGISQRTSLGAIYVTADLFAKIRQYRKKNDFVIVSIHGGIEMMPWPSPMYKSLYRAMVDAGANIVHGHHSHVPQGFELYNGGLIFYGMGNFIVPDSMIMDNKDMEWSLFARIAVKDNKLQEYSIAPLTKTNNVIDVCTKEKYLNYIDMANNVLNKDNLLESLWQSYAVKMYESHYKDWLKVGAHENDFFQLFYHMFNCPTHTEAIKTYFGLKSKELRDMRTVLSNKLVSKYFKNL